MLGAKFTCNCVACIVYCSRKYKTRCTVYITDMLNCTCMLLSINKNKCLFTVNFKMKVHVTSWLLVRYSISGPVTWLVTSRSTMKILQLYVNFNCTHNLWCYLLPLHYHYPKSPPHVNSFLRMTYWGRYQGKVCTTEHTHWNYCFCLCECGLLGGGAGGGGGKEWLLKFIRKEQGMQCMIHCNVTPT